MVGTYSEWNERDVKGSGQGLIWYTILAFAGNTEECHGRQLKQSSSHHTFELQVTNITTWNNLLVSHQTKSPFWRNKQDHCLTVHRSLCCHCISSKVNNSISVIFRLVTATSFNSMWIATYFNNTCSATHTHTHTHTHIHSCINVRFNLLHFKCLIQTQNTFNCD